MFVKFRSARHRLMRQADGLRARQKHIRRGLAGLARWACLESGRVVLTTVACAVSFPVFLLLPQDSGFTLLAWRNGSGKYSESYRQYTILRRTSLVFGFVLTFSLFLWISSLFV